MEHIIIKINVDKEKVTKLCFEVRRPFRIICNTGHGSFDIRKLYKMDSPELSLTIEDLYPPPPSTKPCELIDSSNTIYLNQFYPPVINPLMRDFYIGLYNKT